MDPSCCPILVNDQAGALRNAPTPQQLQELAQELGLNADVIPTRSAEQKVLGRLVREESPKVAVMGGDRTVSLAVQEVAHSATAWGIIRQGTLNNFAMALHPPTDLPSEPPQSDQSARKRDTNRDALSYAGTL